MQVSGDFLCKTPLSVSFLKSLSGSPQTPRCTFLTLGMCRARPGFCLTAQQPQTPPAAVRGDWGACLPCFPSPTGHCPRSDACCPCNFIYFVFLGFHQVLVTPSWTEAVFIITFLNVQYLPSISSCLNNLF